MWFEQNRQNYVLVELPFSWEERERQISNIIVRLIIEITLDCKEPICQCKLDMRDVVEPWVRKIPWRRKWQPIPVFLPGESHGQRSLAGYSL